MKKFIHDQFMLNNKVAEKLYHNYAEKLPIYDYHCHLNPKEIADDISFENIAKVMLGGDHYKWRAMRSAGISEEYITGNASDYDKFMAFAKMMPSCIGNPLYHWTHLELKRFFDIDETLSEKTAEYIWKQCNEKLQRPDFSVRKLIEKSKVKVICTTDDPLDSLEYHTKLAQSGFATKVRPSFRPDKAIEVAAPAFVPYVKQLGATTFGELCAALVERIDFFHQKGCRLADHGLGYVPYAQGNPQDVFAKALLGNAITKEEEDAFKTAMLQMCGREYAKRGWVMQIHIGALRNNNTNLFQRLGADTGFDSINDLAIAQPLSQLLDSLAKEYNLPKTILYTLNPKDNYVLGTMIGNFQDGEIAGKVQFGSGWWFNDQRDGMESQMKALANLGLLSKFVGMLTDSRSFLSYPRHEYFRRILCNLLGTWVERGEYPEDYETLGKIVQDICYYNAEKYFAI